MKTQMNKKSVCNKCWKSEGIVSCNNCDDWWICNDCIEKDPNWKEHILMHKKIIEENKLSIKPSNSSFFNPSIIKIMYSEFFCKDTYWAFEAGEIENLGRETFFSKFCDVFEDDFDNNKKITIIPIALCGGRYNEKDLFEYDGHIVWNPIEDITSKSLDCLKKRFGDKKWWDSNLAPSDFNKNLPELKKVEFQSFFGDEEGAGIEDSIIFWVKDRTFDDIRKIENFLGSLNFCEKLVPVGVAHFEVSGKGVSVFEYN